MRSRLWGAPLPVVGLRRSWSRKPHTPPCVRLFSVCMLLLPRPCPKLEEAGIEYVRCVGVKMTSKAICARKKLGSMGRDLSKKEDRGRA